VAVEFTIATTISEKFSNLIKKDKYESCLCELMNLSTAVFPGRYQRVLEQPSNECDFIDIDTGTKFDAKLPFEKKHGKLIGSEKQRDFTKWLSLMQQQESEFGEDIIASRGKNIACMELYKILSHRLETIEPDEHVIFFFPYPVLAAWSRKTCGGISATSLVFPAKLAKCYGCSAMPLMKISLPISRA